jgi:hypothetical protein
MSNIRGGRSMRSRGGGSAHPSEGSIISSLTSSTSDEASSSINSNDGASKQRLITQSNSGVIRYLFNIKKLKISIK